MLLDLEKFSSEESSGEESAGEERFAVVSLEVEISLVQNSSV